MEDFNALAVALGAGIADVRACLILSGDGLVLGAHPATAEVDARPARIKLAAIGEPERGFLQFGTEVWCYVRRGPYAALTVSGTAARPGLVMDQMEQVLLAAEESRVHRDSLRADAATAAPAVPTTRPRTPLHPDPRPIEEPVVVRADPVPAAEVRPAPAPVAEAPAPVPATDMSTAAAFADLLATPQAAPPAVAPELAVDPRPRLAPPEPEPSAAPAASAPTASDAARPAPRAPASGEPDEPGEVDRFSLAREFSRLLQDDPDPADG
jgi:hypothetical protein